MEAAERELAPASPAALDLHEGISDPRATACRRWPEHLRLRNHLTGELVHGRCRATNRCDYCARLFAVETSELLMLDALEDAPQLYVVLTARELLTRADTYRHLEQLRRRARARWRHVRWAVIVEFQRRGALHLNLLVKGVPVDELDELRSLLVRLWCARVDALPRAQFVGEVSDGGGLVRYIALHFLKPGQAPPTGWRGHRISYSRDYLVRPASVMREEARRSLRLKRLLHRGLTLEAAELELALSPGWSLVHVPGMPLGRDHDRERRAAARAPFSRRALVTRAGTGPPDSGPNAAAIAAGRPVRPNGCPPAGRTRPGTSSPPADVKGLESPRGLEVGNLPRVASP